MSFGLLMGAIGAVGLAIGAIQRKSEDKYLRNDAVNRKRYQNNRLNTYHDSKGRMRDITTNRIVHETINKNGDTVICDEHWNLIRNISEREREEDYRKRKEEAAFYGRKYVVYRYGKLTDDNIYRKVDDICRDNYYRRTIKWNIDTNDMYIYELVPKRKIREMDFYIDCKTGLIEEPASSIERYSADEQAIINNFIGYFNGEQIAGGWVERSFNRAGKYVDKSQPERMFFLDEFYLCMMRISAI